MYVRLKTVEQMFQEYGADYNEQPNVEAGWTEGMTLTVPEDRVIEIHENPKWAYPRWFYPDVTSHVYYISSDMIDEYLGDRLLTYEEKMLLAIETLKDNQ